jgi:omega-amidase
MQNLKITLIQTDISWHNKVANIERFNELIKHHGKGSDLIILPEMFTTGFTMKPMEYAENMDGPAVIQMSGWSDEINADIAGSMIIKEEDKFLNRLVWTKPGGKILFYDKRHLFRMAGEEKVYNSGNKNLTVELKGWKLRPFICYDLRFPVWSRNKNLEYDVAVYSANWPEKRSRHWKSLLRARAIENQCYVIGVNRIGIDGGGISYSGDSTVIDFEGNILFEKSHKECVYTIELSFAELQKYRDSFPAWKDADEFSI